MGVCGAHQLTPPGARSRYPGLMQGHDLDLSLEGKMPLTGKQMLSIE